jgi:MFS-type transporter involved in bile tolerance (Atg22 family)
MEIFIDGGLFELLLAVSLGYIINIIFLKKYLLILFSAISISASILTIFLNKGEVFYFLASINIFNSILLVVLLWKQRTKFPSQPLFNIGQLKRVFYSRFFKERSIKNKSSKTYNS